MVFGLLGSILARWVALFRGVNVGGHNKVPMAKLCSLLESIECRNARHYIQSGNVVFESTVKSKAKLRTAITEAVENEFGFRPALMLLAASEFKAALDNNPFSSAASEPKSLHFYFLEWKPEQPDMDGIAKLAVATERFELKGEVFYLLARAGFGTSKLAAAAERKLGVAATARNFATVKKLAEMLTNG
ncbi:MAG: DUF1697 domain-containing protein [Pirellulales bacterium]